MLLALPRHTAAQSVAGVVREKSDAQPVLGALVTLVDSLGIPRVQGLTNAHGGFFLSATSPGVYRLRVERIGYLATTSPPLTLTVGDTLTYSVEASVQPVALGGIDVKAKRRCEVRPAEGEVVSTVWNEARKALESARQTTSQGLVRYDLRTYERRLGPKAEHVLHQTSSVLHGTGARPFSSLPAAQLMADGFISVTSTARVYYAPDPDVLLSDVFLDSHCLRLATDPHDTTVIGVAFEPSEHRQTADIAGTFWLDRHTDRLSTLRFHYLDDLDRAMESSALGGYEEFEALPSGAWVIRRWWIRGPLVTVHRLAFGNTRKELTGIYETGGEVTNLRVSGVNRFRSSAAVLAGAVWDSLRGGPLPQATVTLRGTAYTARTDSAGRFTVPDVAAGTYDVAFSHPRLDSLGLELPPRSVRVTGSDTARVELAVPSPTTLLAAGCPDSTRAGERGVLVGAAVDSLTGAGLPGARVDVSWAPEAGATPGLDITADGAGLFRACGVPAGVPITLRAEILGRTTVDTLTVPAGAVVRHDVALALGDADRAAAGATPLGAFTVTVPSERRKESLVRGDRVDRLDAQQIDSLSRGTHNIKAVLQNAHMLGISVKTTHVFSGGMNGATNSGTPGVCIEDARAPPPPQNHECRMVLVLVDGVQMDEPEMDLLFLDPRDLYDIEYLPPIEAATRFGTEGGNGALLITTRKGRGGR